MEAQMESLNIQDDNLIILNEEDREYPYDVIPKEQIEQEMELIIAETEEITGLSRDTTVALLKYFAWDKMSLTDRYFENQQQLLKKAGVDLKEECKICLNKKSSTVIYTPKCNHEICLDCWSTHIKINYNKPEITCRHSRCPLVLNKKELGFLSQGVHTFELVLQTTSYIESSRLMKPCPDCSNVFRVADLDCRPVTCSCGSSICMQCGEKWHSPVSCAILKRWLNLAAAKDSKVAKCPKCKEMGYKNIYDTTSVFCRSCKDCFCWICSKPWDMYKDNCCEGKEIRLTLYMPRYENQKQKLDQVMELNNLLQTKKQNMLQLAGQRPVKTWLDHNSWDKALGILQACRKVLMYTNAFEFFLEENNQTLILQNNQRALEDATEQLSFYIQKQECETAYDDLEKAINLMTYCNNRRKMLFDFLAEGSRKMWWILK